MTGPQIEAIVVWLIDGARSAPRPEDVLAQLSARLVEVGLPLWRVAVFVRTLHPQAMGRRLEWRRESGVEVTEAPFALLETSEFRDSTVAQIYASGTKLRRRLGASDGIDFPVLAKLRDEGATDYVALPLVFSDGTIHVITCTTDRSGGFAETEIGVLERLAPPLARIAEIHALRRTAANLLDAYVGHQSGERILAGHIRRGDSETLDAAIWLSDMRGFTSLADRLPPRSLLELLNRYFDCQVPAILEHGGEVLKFIGDGLLAVFPVAGGDAGAVCNRALDAARAARARVAEISGDDAAALRFGLALHRGTVLYGNIGSANRLDFTCIGPAVNLAARLEKLAGRLGRVIVASSEFARLCGGGLTPLGEFTLAGFSRTQTVFGSDEERTG
jgi:adenylate cyclase